MVTLNLLRTHEKKVLSRKDFQLVTALDLIKYLKQIEKQRLLLTYAPIFELLYVREVVTHFNHSNLLDVSLLLGHKVQSNLSAMNRRVESE